MQKILQQETYKEMETSYIDYAMSVIVGRALPDVRDGLKPVHRRILYGMSELGVLPDKPFKKSARIVGEVMGKYHPHGDSSIYDAMVRLAQDFSTRYLLVDGHGNFGSVDGDGAAASRYCITGDTLIKTNKGLLPIKTLADFANGEDLNDIWVEDFRGEMVAATKYFDCGKHPTYKVTLKNGLNINGTSNHPLMVLDENLNFSWKLIGDLSENDKVLLPKNNVEIIKNHSHSEIILAQALGALVSEGFITTYNRFGINNKDINMITPVKEWVESINHNSSSDIQKRPDGTYEYCSCSQTAYGKLVNEYWIGENSYKRQIPMKVFSWGLELQSEFLKYLFEGDGSVRKEGSIVYASYSKKLINELQILLQTNFGIFSRITYSKRGSSKTEIKLTISGEGLIRFKNLIGFISERKQQILDTAINRYNDCETIAFNSSYQINEITDFIRCNYPSKYVNRHNFSNLKNYMKAKPYISDFDFAKIENLIKNYVTVPINEVRPIGLDNVYSVRVDNPASDHSFIANGFINHNTEARMSPFSLEMVRDIKKNSVDFIPNYDGEEMEPVVLPARVPNLLINGSNGIAVGMSTSIPPHNLGEVIDACVEMIDGKPEIDDLCKIIKGPDFPTGAQILGKKEIQEAYRTGQGKLTVRGVAKIEDAARGKSNIIITEIPYQVNKAKLLERISDLVKDKKIEGISAIRDESNRKGMRIVIEVKKDANPNIVLNRLYKNTQLQDTFSVIMLALVNGEPKILNLKEVLEEYLKHQKEVLTRRTQFDLEKAEARAHILEGYRIAQANIDEVVKIIRTSTDNAKEKLMKKFLLSDIQAQAVLDLRLGRLQKLEVEKIEKEYKEIMKLIKYYKSLLKSEKKLMGVVKDELLEIKSKWNDKRRTAIKKAEDELDETDLVEQKEVVITITNQGYVKRTPADLYKAQNKGGKGIVGVNARTDDFVTNIITASTHDTLLFFTSIGKMYSIKAYEIPEALRTARGVPAINFLNLVPREKITAVLPRKEKAKTFLLAVTKNGTVKRTAMEEYNVTKKGTIAVKVKSDDELIAIKETTGKEKVIIVTKMGKSIAFSEEEVRPMGRIAGGVRGIELEPGDEVVSAEVVSPKETLVVVTSKGFAKKTAAGEYRVQARGGKGTTTYDKAKFDKTGYVAGAIIADDTDELLLINSEGIIIKLKAKDIKTSGRKTIGGKVMDTDVEIVAIAKSVKENDQMDQMKMNI